MILSSDLTGSLVGSHTTKDGSAHSAGGFSMTRSFSVANSNFEAVSTIVIKQRITLFVCGSFINKFNICNWRMVDQVSPNLKLFGCHDNLIA